MLRALAEAGIRPDVIVGCSVGAVNGAAFAADPTVAGVERLQRIWDRIEAGNPDLMPAPRLVPVVAQMARKGVSVHDSSKLGQLLAEELPTDRFEGLAVPFHCVATDVERADERWFSSGPLIEPIMASAALPAIYPPVTISGREYIDGGLLHEVHVGRAVELGATELYVLHVGHLSDRMVGLHRPFDGAVRAYWTLRTYRFEADLRRVPEHCVVHRLPAGSKPRLRFDDFSHGTELSDLAYRASRQYLRTGVVPEPEPGPVSKRRSADESELDRRLDAAEWPSASEPAGSTDSIGTKVGERFSGSVGEWSRYSQTATKRITRYRSARKNDVDDSADVLPGSADELSDELSDESVDDMAEDEFEDRLDDGEE